MNVALRSNPTTRAQFLDWAERQEAPYEFDGSVPVAMTGANKRHSQLCRNLVVALWGRLSQTGFDVLPEAGIATTGQAVRYPDVLITNSRGLGTDRLIEEPLIVLEVVSPTSGRVDRSVKLREYRAVRSIRRYVIVDSEAPDLTVFVRARDVVDWTADALTAGDILDLPEVGISLSVDEIFKGIGYEPAS